MTVAQTPKPPVPAWRWAAWWTVLGAAIVVFYVLLTPVWIGLRVAAWLAEARARWSGQDTRARPIEPRGEA